VQPRFVHASRSHADQRARSLSARALIIRERTFQASHFQRTLNLRRERVTNGESSSTVRRRVIAFAAADQQEEHGDRRQQNTAPPRSHCTTRDSYKAFFNSSQFYQVRFHA
jgi:hypothetical protein